MDLASCGFVRRVCELRFAGVPSSLIPLNLLATMHAKQGRPEAARTCNKTWVMSCLQQSAQTVAPRCWTTSTRLEEMRHIQL